MKASIDASAIFWRPIAQVCRLQVGAQPLTRHRRLLLLRLLLRRRCRKPRPSILQLRRQPRVLPHRRVRTPRRQQRRVRAPRRQVRLRRRAIFIRVRSVVRSMRSAVTKARVMSARRRTPKARPMRAVGRDGARRRTKIASCQRKQKNEKPVCVARKPIMASAQTWGGASRTRLEN